MRDASYLCPALDTMRLDLSGRSLEKDYRFPVKLSKSVPDKSKRIVGRWRPPPLRRLADRLRRGLHLPARRGRLPGQPLEFKRPGPNPPRWHGLGLAYYVN